MNYNCQVSCVATANGAVVQGRMQFHNGLDWQGENEDAQQLPPVNPEPRGGQS
jgi:hypothetical protein